jgi:hypothetical protein
LFRACDRGARKGAKHDAIREEGTPSIELQDPSRDTAGLPSAQAVNQQGPARDRRDGGRGEESSYYLLPSIGVELADVKPEVVSGSVHPDAPTVVLKRGNASGDNLHSNHGSHDAGFPEVADPWAECLQGLLRKGLAGQVVSMTGGTPVMRKSSDSLRMSTKSQRLRKSLTFFIHFKLMKSPSVLAVVMKETQPEL